MGEGVVVLRLLSEREGTVSDYVEIGTFPCIVQICSYMYGLFRLG